MEPEYVVAFDILDEGIGGRLFLGLFVWLAGVAVGVVMLRRSLRPGPPGPLVLFALWLVIWGCGGGLGVANTFHQRLRSLAWARDGDFGVVEGEVRNFHPVPRGGKGPESFTVAGVRFVYSASDGAGFNHVALDGGPMRPGQYVRISHRNGRILKIEVRR